MDYNKNGHGVVCKIYDLMKKRWFFAGLSSVALALTAILYYELADLLCCGTIALFLPLLVTAFALLFICIKPTNFFIRISGLLMALGSIFVSLHKMKLVEANTFYIVLIFAFFLLFLLLSWFVYNARSNEINEL